jgi:hypothetical protein
VFTVPRRDDASECVIITTCPTTYKPTLESIWGTETDTEYKAQTDYDFIPTTKNTWALWYKNSFLDKEAVDVEITYTPDYSPEKITEAGEHVLDLVAIFEPDTYINGTYIIEADKSFEFRIAGIQTAEYAQEDGLEDNIRFIRAWGAEAGDYFGDSVCEELGTGTGRWEVKFKEMESFSVDADMDGVRRIRITLLAEQRN